MLRVIFSLLSRYFTPTLNLSKNVEATLLSVFKTGEQHINDYKYYQNPVAKVILEKNLINVNFSSQK